MKNYDDKSDRLSFRTDRSANNNDLDILDPTPAYEEEASGSAMAGSVPTAAPPPIPKRPADQPARLMVHGATWGGINVTDDVRAMVTADQQLACDMRTLWQILLPDPAPATLKALTVLYQYDDSHELHLLNAHEGIKHTMHVSKTAHEATQPGARCFAPVAGWSPAAYGAVEILSVVYGPETITTPAVLLELASFFDGKRGQIRMTNAFFKKDTWPKRKKSWTVYFRFPGSKRGVQVVTGMEGGALELPWSRC